MQRCLTLRSRGPPPARHLAREAVWFIIRLAGQAPSRLRPLSSNYKGFPRCQDECSSRAAPAARFTSDYVRLRTAASPRSRASRRVCEPRCGRTNYNRSLLQRCSLPSVAADPDEKRARGPHSLAADSTCAASSCSGTPRAGPTFAHRRWRITRWKTCSSRPPRPGRRWGPLPGTGKGGGMGRAWV